MEKIFHRLVSSEEAIDIISSKVYKSIKRKELDLNDALGYVISDDVYSEIDIPPFDRSEVDGFAVNHKSVEGAEEDNPVTLKIKGEIQVGKMPDIEIMPGEAAYISTGSVIPRGADAVVMVEHTSKDKENVRIYRSLAPGENISHAGSDFSYGEVLCRKGDIVLPETVALLSAAGINKIEVFDRLGISVFSSGNELKEPGFAIEEGQIYDVNSPYFIAAFNSTGICRANFAGIIKDNLDEATALISSLEGKYNLIVSSGSTSAGFHDMLYKAVEKVGGTMLFHGISIKPGKPTFAADLGESLFIGMPGFPLSSASVLNYIVIPAIKKAYGLPPSYSQKMKIPFKINGEKGKDYIIPGIISRNNRVYPVFGDSGSISRMVYSDGFIVLSRNNNYYSKDEEVDFYYTGKKERDILCIGSNDPLLERVIFSSFKSPAIINAGSMGGVEAMRDGESDVGGIHLLKGEDYNKFVMDEEMRMNSYLLRGFMREQGFVSRDGINSFREIVDKNLIFINRNKGSGTRDLIESLIIKELGKDFPKEKIRGYFWEAKSHGAVSRAVKQGRGDVGISIRYYADILNIQFHKIKDENYDILVSKKFYNSENGKMFIEKLKEAKKYETSFPGYIVPDDIGEIII